MLSFSTWKNQEDNILRNSTLPNVKFLSVRFHLFKTHPQQLYGI